VDSVREGLSVLAVLGLLGAALWSARGRASRFLLRTSFQKSATVETIERISLTPQHALHLVRVRGRELVLVTHSHGCTLILEGGEGNPS
jgi:flagellar biogenesis protein FliO